MYPDDLVKYYKVWDKKIEKVFPHIIELNQPLVSLIEEEKWERINNIIENKLPMDSILNIYYPQSKQQS